MSEEETMRGIVMPEVDMPAESKLITTQMELDLLARVDDFRFSERFKSRAAAMKWLMDAALRTGLRPTPEERAQWA
jgi:hypothetical protein